MSIDLYSPRFPLHETLVRFFQMDSQSRLEIVEVAELLGTTRDVFESMLRDEGGRQPGDGLTWAEAASYVFDAWPRARIIAALGQASAKLIPAAAHLTSVQWALPIFIVRAMEQQAAAAWQRDPRLLASVSSNHTSARGVEDYVADLLFSQIQPETLVAFRDDSDFLRAYHYPDGD